MKTDGSVIIDTRIVDGGMEKGFEAIKKEMSSVGVAAEDLGDKIKQALSGGTVSVQKAFAKVKDLESQLAAATAEAKDAAKYGDDRDAERFGKKREVIYNRLEVARQNLTAVVYREAKKEEAAEEKAAQKALREKERAYKKATKSARAFGKRLTSIMASALVFNVISQGLREVTKYFGDALKSNKKFSDAWSTLKGAVLTAIQPIYEVLLPALITTVNVAAKLARMIGNVFASLSGKSAQQIKENAESLYEQAKATEETGKAAKNAKKHLAGFDEINVMNNNDSSESDSGTDSAKFEFQDIDIDSKLSEMATLTSAAVFALGIILTLSGANIPLGLGMVTLGGMALYESIAENWGSVQSNVISTAEAIAFLSSAVLLAIGIIIAFCCPTHLGLGIGLIIAGVAGLVTVVATNWNAIKESLQTPLGATVALIAGAVFIVLGILCCFAGVWALGIGCIVVGAAAVATTVAVNWNAIKEALQGPIGIVTAVVSAALLVIGAIIAFSGVGLVLGISLMAAGAVGLVTTVALNWNAIVTKVKETFSSIGEWIETHGLVMLILGIVLLFTGFAIPIGLALIGLGVKGMVSGKDPLWNVIFDKIKEVWQNIKNFWNQHIAPVFTGKFWTDLAKKCGNGLISGFEGAINGIISMFESMINWVVNGLNKISFDVPDWVPAIGGKKFGFNIPEVKFSRVSIPRLAQGAVIPPNREFMAVLGDQKHGTNIEAPLETIKQALAEVLALQEGTGKTVVQVNFTGSLAQLARVLKPEIDIENRRTGGSLVKGAVF